MNTDVSGQSQRRVKVWDLPTRAFHWLLAASVVGSFVTVKLGLMEWHGRIGGFVLSLLLFRLVWGFWGSETARFARFVPSPQRLVRYLRGQAEPQLGHNPLGALSVMALLGAFTLQALAGLATSDEIAYDGPLVSVVSDAWVEWAGWVHLTTEPLLLVLVGLHLVAIGFYRVRRKQNLLRPMLTGYTSTEQVVAGQEVRDRWSDRLRAALLWGLAACGVAMIFIGV
ncbi:MAG: hypothetical protein RJA77_1150 [Pseudomonadota bacterium]